ncbi:MAG: hypothetical protein ACD_49C00072G0010 [uncultured bacterium (gcode 4)]|uniref:Uncharacterized protein n=1 Tax=uncultured bacterium (gcode 4) TaxID=1234023 RepID=K2BB33_9BACT|nr:MAG: hypothetical protein ACD_49C00072G0010 [uncultured bacterium (gcode 4)]
MKKSKIYLIWFFLLVILSAIYHNYDAIADEVVNVYAIVWNPNNQPIIMQTIPSFDPIVIKRNSIQNFSLVLKDIDSSTINYTITSLDGSNFPINWNFTDAVNLTAWTANLNFTYFSPNYKKTDETITLTVDDNDWNIITKTINLYVY